MLLLRVPLPVLSREKQLSCRLQRDSSVFHVQTERAGSECGCSSRSGGRKQDLMFIFTKVFVKIFRSIGRASGSRYMARLRAIGAYWGLSETIEGWSQE